MFCSIIAFSYGNQTLVGIVAQAGWGCDHSFTLMLQLGEVPEDYMLWAPGSQRASIRQNHYTMYQEKNLCFKTGLVETYKRCTNTMPIVTSKWIFEVTIGMVFIHCLYVSTTCRPVLEVHNHTRPTPTINRRNFLWNWEIFIFHFPQLFRRNYFSMTFLVFPLL